MCCRAGKKIKTAIGKKKISRSIWILLITKHSRRFFLASLSGSFVNIQLVSQIWFIHMTSHPTGNLLNCERKDTLKILPLCPWAQYLSPVSQQNCSFPIHKKKGIKMIFNEANLNKSLLSWQSPAGELISMPLFLDISRRRYSNCLWMNKTGSVSCTVDNWTCGLFWSTSSKPETILPSITSLQDEAGCLTAHAEWEGFT